MAEVPSSPCPRGAGVLGRRSSTTTRAPDRVRAGAASSPRREQRLARVPRRTTDRASPTACATGAPTHASASWCSCSSRVVAGVVWYRIGIGGASAATSPARASRAVTTTASSAATTSRDRRRDAQGQPSTIVVHVAGAVTHPGVVELRTRRSGHRRGRGGRRRAGRRRPRPAQPRRQGRRRRAGLRRQGRSGRSRASPSRWRGGGGRRAGAAPARRRAPR